MKNSINIPYIKLLLIFIMGASTMSCSKDDGTGISVKAPGAADLVLPQTNTECVVGEISGNKASVDFEWDEASDAEFYDLVITNLVSQEVTQELDLSTTALSVNLERGYPYSWKVISKNAGEETTSSDLFRFYVAGEAGSNNVPFPATLLSPASGVTVSPVNGKVRLEWQGDLTDTDGDPLTFTLFADIVDGNQEPPEEWKGITETSMEIDVNPNSKYYWHIETSDGKSTAISNTYSFNTDDNGSSVDGKVVSTSQEILGAIAEAVPGENIYIRGGAYTFNSTIKINTSGSADSMISLLAFPEDDTRPKFDFSSMSENSSNRGVEVSADYWHIKGIDFVGAGDNGMKIEGNNNLIEFCTFSECADTGLQLDTGASNNTILNCDSFFNADSSIENADGFACKLTAGTGNKFIGCRAWNNLDDGWDGYLREADNITTTYENCWAIRNGYLEDGTAGGGDGNGFKTGGSDDKQLKHNAVYTNCLAVGNLYDGFDHNSNRGEVTLYNCSAFDNGTNYNFSSTNPLSKLVIKNSLVLGEKGKTDATETDIAYNSWQLEVEVSEADFQSMDVEELMAPRKADGSLPDISFMHLVAGSDLIDKGVDVGLPYNGSAPDLGAFEYEE